MVNWRSQEFVSDVKWKGWKWDFPIFENWLDRRKKYFDFWNQHPWNILKRCEKSRRRLLPWAPRAIFVRKPGRWKRNDALGAHGNKSCQQTQALLFIWTGVVWWSYEEFRHLMFKNAQDNEMSQFGMVFSNYLFFLNSVLNSQFSSYGSEILNSCVLMAIF